MSLFKIIESLNHVHSEYSDLILNSFINLMCASEIGPTNSGIHKQKFTEVPPARF